MDTPMDMHMHPLRSCCLADLAPGCDGVSGVDMDIGMECVR